MATTFYAFRVPVVTSGTPVQLDTFAVEPDQTVLVKAKATNTGVISIGNSSAEAVKSNAENFLLSAGQSVELKVPNTNEIWIDSTISGDIVEVVVGGSGTGGSGGSGTSASQVQGNVASGATDSGNPVKTGGKYNVTPPTLTDGQRGDTQMDANGNTKVNLATGIAGEDLGTDRLLTLPVYDSVYITTATTTTALLGPGVLHTITVEGGTAGTITIYDDTTATGTATHSYDSTNTLMNHIIDEDFSLGLVIVTSAATKVKVTFLAKP